MGWRVTIDARANGRKDVCVQQYALTALIQCGFVMSVFSRKRTCGVSSSGGAPSLPPGTCRPIPLGATRECEMQGG